jgi:H+/Cl- antiporter ClcA
MLRTDQELHGNTCTQCEQYVPLFLFRCQVLFRQWKRPPLSSLSPVFLLLLLAFAAFWFPSVLQVNFGDNNWPAAAPCFSHTIAWLMSCLDILFYEYRTPLVGSSICSLVVAAWFWFIQKSVSNQYKQITWHGFFLWRLGNLRGWAHLYLVIVGGHALNNWFRDLWYHMPFLKGPADYKFLACLVPRLDSAFSVILSWMLLLDNNQGLGVAG